MTTNTQAPGAFQALRDAAKTVDHARSMSSRYPSGLDRLRAMRDADEAFAQAAVNAAPALLAEVERCHRSLKAAGFTDNGGEAWEPPIPQEATALVNMLRESQAEVARLNDQIDTLHHNANILQTALTLAQADAAKSERRAIMFGDIVQTQVLAMRAAVVDAKLQGPEAGMTWIENTLEGPGHLPDVGAAKAEGGAQALFDREMAEHEAFRAAHPGPAAARSTK